MLGRNALSEWTALYPAAPEEHQNQEKEHESN
jgi:hypothetical protein